MEYTNYVPEFKEQMLKWYEQFENLSTEPVTKETTEFFLNCLLNEQMELPEEMGGDSLYQMVTRRAGFLGLTLTPGLTAFLMLVSEGIPGRAVMYLTALKCRAIRNNNMDCSLDTLTQICPNGFPSEESLRVLWYFQKTYNTVGTDNILDIAFV